MEDRIEPPGHLRLIVVKRLERNISEQNLGYEQNIRFRVEVISDDGSKSKQTDNDSHKVDADRSDYPCNALLQERDSRIAAVRPVAGQEDQEYCCGTDQKSIYIHGDDLRQSLFCRV